MRWHGKPRWWYSTVGLTLAAVVLVGAVEGIRTGADRAPGAATVPSTDDAEIPDGRAVPLGADGPLDLTGRVVRVIDGDTIRVESRGFETPVRLIGIDAPETRKPGAAVQCFGPEATRRTRALLSGRRVRLIGDPSQDTRDRFGRLLAYASVDGTTQTVNEQLVEGGFARVYVYRQSGPFRHVAAFRAAEARARNARRGLWGAACRYGP